MTKSHSLFLKIEVRKKYIVKNFGKVLAAGIILLDYGLDKTL